MVKDEPMRDWARNAATPAVGRAAMSRRAFMRRSGGVGLGAAAVWSAPSIRTTVLAAGTTGTPAPQQHTGSESTPSASDPVAPTDPAVDPVVDPAVDPAVDPNAAATGRLPLTGTNPRGLLVAGGAAIVAGGALLSVSNDPEPTRRQD